MNKSIDIYGHKYEKYKAKYMALRNKVQNGGNSNIQHGGMGENILLEEFVNRRKDFFNNSEKVKNLIDFQQKREGGLQMQTFNRDNNDKLKGNVIWGKMTSFFTVLVDPPYNRTGTKILHEDDKFILIHNKMLPYIDLDGNGGAGMSFVHLLAIPKKTIYNAISLVHTNNNSENSGNRGPLVLTSVMDDVELIEHMQKIVETYWKTNKKEICIDIKDKVIARLNSDDNNKEKKINYKRTDIETYMDAHIGEADTSTMNYYFHVHPDHSVGHLHMHCILENKNNTIRNKSSLDHDKKSLNVNINSQSGKNFIEYLKNEKTTNLTLYQKVSDASQKLQ